MSVVEVQLLLEQSWPVTVHVHSRVTEGKVGGLEQEFIRWIRAGFAGYWAIY